MFFVRERRVKIISVLLLLNVYWTLGELPASSYLPPNRDDQSGKFSSGIPTGQNYNTNSAPIETSISLTTSEPLSYNPSSFNGFNQGNPVRNQQSPAGNNGYSYQQPNPPFKDTYAAPGGSLSGQNYQPIGTTYSQQPSSSSSIGASQSGQNYQPAGLPSSFFNSPSPTYGPPVNTSVGFEDGRGNAPSSPNLPQRRPAALSPNTLPGSFIPLPNSQIPSIGNSQGFPPGAPGLSTNYGPPSPSGSSFGNFPSFGGNINPAFNPIGSGGPPANPNRNQYTSSGPTNVPIGQLSNNFGAGGTPQTLYGAPGALTPNRFIDNTNLSNRRPPSNFGGNVSPQTLYNSPISSAQTDGFSPQGNRNKGTSGPLSPTYGPPTNTFPFGNNSPSFRPQDFERPSQQQNRPLNNSGAGYQNTSNVHNSSPNNFNSPPNQIRPSSPTQISSNPSSSQTGYLQRVQNQQPSVSPTFGLPLNQGNRTSYTAPSNTYQPPLRSFAGEKSPQSSYLPPSLNTLSNPSGSGFRTNGGYETSISPTNSFPSGSGFGVSGENQEPSRSSTSGTHPSSEFGISANYEAPKLPISPNSGFNDVSSSHGTPSTNSLHQEFSSLNQVGYPGSSGSNSFGNISPSTEAPRPSNFNSPSQQGYPSSSGSNGLGNISPSTEASQPSNFNSLSQQGYPSSSDFNGFNNISPSTETSRPSNFNSLSPSYGPPTRDYTDISSSNYNNPTSPEQGNTFFANTNSFGEFSNTDGNTQPPQSTSFNQGAPAQSAYSGFYNEPNSPPYTSSGSTNTETQPGQNFGTNPASSYLPPNQSGNTPFNNNDVVPSTSYTLPSDQPNSSRPGTPNTPKNTHRNVGSDLITGASTSPFLPFKDDSSKPNAAPSRTTYEKSQEVTSNDLGTSGYDSGKPAKYQFNYDVKGSGPEFSHQESRNGSTTSGSYGVVLPDGRKQVVDYEANQEGFHPKIRYEETHSNSLQQNSQQNNDLNQGYSYSPNIPSTQNLETLGNSLKQNSQQNNDLNQGYSYSPNIPSTQNLETPSNSLQQNSQQNNDLNQGYSYLPNTPSTQNFSQSLTPNVDSFIKQGTSSSYPQIQQSYPSRPDYSLGTVANQDSYTSPYDSSSPQSGYPINNQEPASNFNTYSNQGTSPSNPNTFDSNQSSQFNDNHGYDYTPGGNSNNQASSYDSGSGYPAGPNFKIGTKQIPFFN